MTDAELRTWGEKMGALNALGLPTQARIEIGGLDIDVEMIRRIGRAGLKRGLSVGDVVEALRAEAKGSDTTMGNAGPFSNPSEERSISATAPTDSNADGVPDTSVVAVPCVTGQDEAEVLADVGPGAEPGGALPGKVKVATSSNKRSGTRRRRSQLRTVEKDSESMPRVQVKTKNVSVVSEEPQLRITREKTTTKPKGPDHGRPAVSPVLINAETAASLCCVSRSQWFVMKRAGRTPAWIMMGRKPVWRIAELLDWINAGCPPKDRWKWRG